jgi:hypothetical protein
VTDVEVAGLRRFQPEGADGPVLVDHRRANDLLIDAAKDALASAGITIRVVDAFWLGTLFSGNSGLTLSRPLKIDYKPVTRIENFCATGSEAIRNACYAVGPRYGTPPPTRSQEAAQRRSDHTLGRCVQTIAG